MIHSRHRILFLGVLMVVGTVQLEADEKPARDILIVATPKAEKENPSPPFVAFGFHGERISLVWVFPNIDESEIEYRLDLFRLLTTTAVPLVQNEAPSKVEEIGERGEIQIEYDFALPESSAVSQTFLVKVWRKREGKQEAVSLVFLHSVLQSLDFFQREDSISWVPMEPIEGEQVAPPQALLMMAPSTIEVLSYEESSGKSIAFVELKSIEQLDEFQRNAKHPERVIFVPVKGFDSTNWTPPEKIVSLGESKAVILSSAAADIDKLSPKDIYLLQQLLNEGN